MGVMKTLLFLLFPVIALPSEGDAFSARLHHYEDMNARLSLEVENRLNEALQKANGKDHKCDQAVALKAIEKKFLRPVVGIFETWASFSSEVKGHQIKYKDSIYRDLKLKENLPVHLGKLGMATFFKINKTLVASDKFGHFFDEGHTYFKMVHKEGKSFNEALQHGIDLENGIYGIKRSKVFSYADLVANRNGYDFWVSLFNDKDNNNYITCSEGVFKLSRKFNFAEYVDDGWDEAINCNRYDPSVEDRVNNVIAELEKKSGFKLACPAERFKCGAITAKYQDHKDLLISPACY